MELQAAPGEHIPSSILKQPNRISSDEPLITGGLVDLFSLIYPALFVEDKFGVHLDDTELTPRTLDHLDQPAARIESRQRH